MLSNRIAYLASPPRLVPLQAACSAMLGVMGSVGALVFTISMIAVLLFTKNLYPLDEWRLSRSTATAQATVNKVIGISVEENDKQVYEYRFTFRTLDEKIVSGRSYSAGQVWSEGEQVRVWYLPDKPTVARLENTRLSMLPLWAMLVMIIFPIQGSIMFILACISGVKQVLLLVYGEVTGARTLSQQRTSTRVNGQPVIKYTYEFHTKEGMIYTGSSRSLSTGRIGDEANEPVLYLPSNPKVSMLVDSLPLKLPLEVDGAGQWASTENFWPIFWFALAGASVAISLLLGGARVLGKF